MSYRSDHVIHGSAMRTVVSPASRHDSASIWVEVGIATRVMEAEEHCVGVDYFDVLSISFDETVSVVLPQRSSRVES